MDTTRAPAPAPEWDPGRLLDSEITAPLDSTPAGVVHPPAWRLLLCMAPPSAWRLPLYKAPSSMARALCKAPLINGACSLQSALALGACSLQGALTSPCARGHFIRHTGLRVPSQPKANFLMSVAFPKKRCILLHLAHASYLLQLQARRRALRVLLGSSRPTTRAARPVRHEGPSHTRTHSRQRTLSVLLGIYIATPPFRIINGRHRPHSHRAEYNETSTDGRSCRPESPPQSTARYDMHFQ